MGLPLGSYLSNAGYIACQCFPDKELVESGAVAQRNETKRGMQTAGRFVMRGGRPSSPLVLSELCTNSPEATRVRVVIAYLNGKQSETLRGKTKLYICVHISCKTKIHALLCVIQAVMFPNWHTTFLCRMI